MRSVYFLVLAAVYMSATAQLNFNYLRQDLWGEDCNIGGMRQTPVNIVTADVECSEELIPIEFNDRWTDTLNGTFLNGGINVRFVADGPGATIRNHLGMYQNFNFHMHWGPQDNNGTGHQINGEQFGLEFHFVNVRADLIPTFSFGPGLPQDTISVICVLAEAVDEPISGPWAKLDPTRVTNANDSIPITDFDFQMVLPENKDYYYYPGGTTSPGCYEFVHWFVLKERIQVPSAYVAQLRTTRFDSGELVMLNRRNVQDLAGRTVLTLGSVGQAASVLVLVGSALLVCFYNLL